MTSLRRLQVEMQRCITTGAYEVAILHTADSEDTAQRLEIYASAYRSRLQEALAHNFPMLRAHLENDVFATLAHAYLDAYPSTSTSVRHFGQQLPQWLATVRPDEPWLAEFAQLEWSLGCAFDAPDDDTVSMHELASVAPTDWAGLKFEFARSVQRLTLSTNAVELYAGAARGEREISGPRLTPPLRSAADCNEGTPSRDQLESCTEWLIWRQNLGARYRSMTAVEALVFDTLTGGETFGEACARLLEANGTDDEVPLQAAACLKRWLADGLVATFSIVPA